MIILARKLLPVANAFGGRVGRHGVLACRSEHVTATRTSTDQAPNLRIHSPGRFRMWGEDFQPT